MPLGKTRYPLCDDATADELREEIMRRLSKLQEARVLDLTALPVPTRRLAN